MNKENKTSDKQQKGNDFIADVSNSIYPVITKSKIWIGCEHTEYLIETTTEIGENYGGQSVRIIDNRNII